MTGTLRKFDLAELSASYNWLKPGLSDMKELATWKDGPIIVAEKIEAADGVLLWQKPAADKALPPGKVGAAPSRTQRR